jgi:hypothetical protein
LLWWAYSNLQFLYREEYLERVPEYLSDPDMIAASLVEQEYLQALGKRGGGIEIDGVTNLGVCSS